MKNLIVLGTNYYQLPLVLKAQSLGYEVHLFGIGLGSEREKQLSTISSNHVNFYYPISIYEKEAILDTAKKINAIGIVSIGADNVVQTISYVATRMGWTCNTEECALVSTNKYEMKKRFKANNIPTTDFIYTDKVEPLPFDYPVVVKAVDKAGKIGITKVEKEEGLAAAIAYGLEFSSQDKVLVEKFAEGKEYSAEGISWKGKHTVLNFTDKWSNPPNFVEEMHSQPSRLSNEIKIKMEDVVKRALTALDIQYGPSHTEFKVDEHGNINIIEIASRMAAENMCDLVEVSTGVDYIKATLDIALGKAPDLPIKRERCTAVKFLITEKDFERFEWVKKNHSSKIHRISPVVEPFDGRRVYRNGDRYGFYIVNCSTLEEVFNLCLDK